MTATLISLISILSGILGANLTGLLLKKYSFDLIGNTIAGVFGSILVIKSLGRLGFDPNAIMASGNTSWFLFTINVLASFSGGALSIVFMKKVENRIKKSK